MWQLLSFLVSLVVLYAIFVNFDLFWSATVALVGAILMLIAKIANKINSSSQQQ